MYRGLYPLIMMLPTGAKRMGDVELGIRFSTSGSMLDVLPAYGPASAPGDAPPTAYPGGEPRGAAAGRGAHHRGAPGAVGGAAAAAGGGNVDAGRLGTREFSMRKLRANWNRAVAALSYVADAVRWVEDTRSWWNPTANAMAHAVLVLLAWHPDLVVPTLALDAAAVGVWKYQRRPRAPVPHPCVRASMAEAPDSEELDDEFDTIRSARLPELVRVRPARHRLFHGRGADGRGPGAAGVQAAATDDPYSVLSRWSKSDPDPCGWPDVRCANASSSLSSSSSPAPRGVVGLGVAGKNISGYIPSELGSLLFLRSLNLHVNRLSGAIPAALSNASSLHSLYLYGNRLTGGLPAAALCNLPRLQNLDVSGNALSGGAAARPPRLPQPAAARARLERLLLDGYDGRRTPGRQRILRGPREEASEAGAGAHTRREEDKPERAPEEP